MKSYSKKSTPSLFSPRKIDINQRADKIIALFNQTGFALPLEPEILKNPKLHEEKDFIAAIDFIESVCTPKNPMSPPEPLSPKEKRQKTKHESKLAELFAKYRTKFQKNKKEESDGCCTCS